MKFFLLILLFSLTSIYVCHSQDDEFSEFNDPDDALSEQIVVDNEPAKVDQNALNEKLKDSDEKQSVKEKNIPEKDDESAVETETVDEGNFLQDSEEFEGFDKESKKEPGKPDLKIAHVPHHLTTSWENYYLELLMIAGLVVYMANFVKGKTRNQKLANAWFKNHKEMLEENFSLVGDDGSATPKQGELNKESENQYNLWCSGRVAFEGMLIELKLLKRQDLVSVVSRMMRPLNDQIIVKVILDDSEMEGFVMCIANKKKVNSLLKEYQDLATFCPEKKSLKNSIPDSFALLSEIPEASSALIDSKVQRIFKDYEDNIEFMIISDQFTGATNPQDAEPNTSKLPETKKCLLFGFKIGNKGQTTTQQMEATRPLLQFVLYMSDKARRIRLGKESRLKSDKNRQKAIDSYERSVHAQRQEAAQARRAEKVRAEKERLMAEEDPEKARKLEQYSQKREAKSKQPKMKMLKIAR